MQRTRATPPPGTIPGFEALLAVAALLSGGAAAKPAATPAGGGGAFGLAMIFVLFTYGGWNEAAYLAGEVRDAQRNMLRVLVGGIIAVTALYLLVNLGYLAALGIDGVRETAIYLSVVGGV